ncbi:MAG: hypothetical protein RR228_02640 [Bacilli bacterium]
MNFRLNAEFEKNLDKLKEIILAIISKKQLAETRAKTAEEALTRFRSESSKEIERAYKEGYQKGKQSVNTDIQGGRTKEDYGLVYTNKN